MTAPIPKYQRIINDIIRKIESGELKPNDELPSWAQMRAQYQVSATPVYLAMRELKALGYVVGLPGVRMYVASNPATSNEWGVAAARRWQRPPHPRLVGTGASPAGDPPPRAGHLQVARAGYRSP